MSIVFVGDIHGKWDSFFELTALYPESTIILLGDVNIGFPRNKHPEDLGDNVLFIRGNHDNPNACSKHKNYLGDYGVKIIDNYKIGFISGGYSIDQDMLIEDHTWWRNEELSYGALNNALDLFYEEKPSIIISHEGPRIALDRFLTNVYPTRTNDALSVLQESLKGITHWFFGHYHQNFSAKIRGTQFECMQALGYPYFRVVSL